MDARNRVWPKAKIHRFNDMSLLLKRAQPGRELKIALFKLEVYSEPSRVRALNYFTFSHSLFPQKSSILDVRLGSECASASWHSLYVNAIYLHQSRNWQPCNNECGALYCEICNL